MTGQDSCYNRMHLISIIIVISLTVSQTSLAQKLATGSQQISIRMPDLRPDHADQYLCIAHRLPQDMNGQYIVGFNPQGNTSKVHHMLLYGCSMPGAFQRDSPNLVWDCGMMHSSSMADNQPQSFDEGPVCQGEQQILYGWALDAPALHLPRKVGFKVGGLDTNIKFLVLQVHFGHYHAFSMQPDLTDNSGLILEMKPNDAYSGITRQAGVLLLISLGYVEQGKSQHEIWCDIEDEIEIHPFRYRVHTHKLGTKVLGAKVAPGSHRSMTFGGDSNKDVIIGIGDPQKPQMFYPVKEKNLTMTKGDSVYARCEFYNNKSHTINIGQTGDDEMCNFYLMYWTDSPKLLSRRTCFGQNPKKLFDFSSVW